ncbi:MAG: co-chaperone GroES [Planctomycetes bacterium]|nr:co-chaperone GroES [Planctomycetota bacterium]
MQKGRKSLHVVGDRVLVKLEEGESRTQVGLLLPPGALDKEAVQSGIVVAVGPGTALPPLDEDSEPWKLATSQPRYLPMQVAIGDTTVFFRKAAMEITFEGDKYLVVPYAAMLVIVRETKVPDSLPEDF